MAILKSLEKLLKQNKIKFQILTHRKVFTGFDAAETQHLKVKEVGKAVLLKGKKQFYLCLLSAGSNCDFKALSKIVNDKVSMAKEKDIATKLKTKVGLIAPFGKLYGLPLAADSTFLKNKKLNLPGGSYTESVVLNAKDYIRLEAPLTGKFSKKK